MSGLAILGLFLIIYGLFVFFIAAKKPEAVWKMGKIQGFVKVLGEKGTVIFFFVWGTAAVVGGVLLMVFNQVD